MGLGWGNTHRRRLPAVRQNVPPSSWPCPAFGAPSAMNLYAIQYKWQYHIHIIHGAGHDGIKCEFALLFLCVLLLFSFLSVFFLVFVAPSTRQSSLSPTLNQPEHTLISCAKNPFTVYYFLFSTSFQLHLHPCHNTPFSVSVKRTIDYYYNFIVCEQ